MPNQQLIEANKVNSVAEDEFVKLFCEVFGYENASLFNIQYPIVDIF